MLILTAKILQASGLAVMAWFFIKAFPRIMPLTAFLFAAVLFGLGWAILFFCKRK